MKIWPVVALALAVVFGAETPAAEIQAASKKVYVLPVREDIMPPLVYLVRRGVKEAMEAKADLLVLDMKTNGGRVDTTREIISILEQFPGDTLTYVNKDAFSAGAFISVATKRIYMAPGSVIGAAAPIMLSPGGEGIEKVPDLREKDDLGGAGNGAHQCGKKRLQHRGGRSHDRQDQRPDGRRASHRQRRRDFDAD